MDRQRYRRRRVSGRGSLHRAEEGRAIQSGSTIMAIRFFVQYNNNNGSPLRSALGSATAATTAATIESIRPIRPPSLPPSVAAVRMIMGKESLHISPIHLSFGVTEGETRSGPLTFLGRMDGRTGISVLGIGTGDDDDRRRRWHNTTALRCYRRQGGGERGIEGQTGATTARSIVLLQKGQPGGRGGIYTGYTGRLIIPQSIAQLLLVSMTACTSVRRGGRRATDGRKDGGCKIRAV